MIIANPSQPSSDRLTLLYRLSQTFNSSLDLDEVLNRVMDEVIAAMRAERGFVMLHAADGELVFHVARGMDQGERMRMYGQADRILVEEAPILPLVYGRFHTLVKPWVKKFPTSPMKVWFWKGVIIEPH